MRFTGLTLFSLLVLTALFRPAGGSAATDLRVRISNLNDVSFTVSWLTTSDESGQVQFVDGPIYNDDRGTSYAGKTHYVTVAGLLPGHTYSFDILSGSTRFDNAGAHWTVKTGATLTPRTADWLAGQVQNPDGSAATDVVLYATIYRVQGGFNSAPISALVTPRDGGVFRMRLSDARVAGDPSSFMEYTPGDRYGNNEVSLQAFGPAGSALVTIEMADPRLHSADAGQIIVRLSPDRQATVAATLPPTGTPTSLPPTPTAVPPTPTMTATSAPVVEATPSESATGRVDVIVETIGVGIPDYAIMVTDFGTRSVARHEEIEKNHYRDYLSVPLNATFTLTVFIHNPDAPCEDPAMENCNYVLGKGDKPMFTIAQNKPVNIVLQVEYTRGPTFSADSFTVTSTLK